MNLKDPSLVLPPESITGNIFEFEYSRELVNLFKSYSLKITKKRN